MENRSHALAAGAFVLVVAALLAALALWLTRDQTSYTRYELSSRESVSGLQPQAAVRYKGVAVGKVQSIGFDPQKPGNVLIRIAVDTQAPIGPTTFATLGYQGVTGLAHVLLDDATHPLRVPATGASGLPRLPLRTSPLGQIAEQGPLIVAQVQEATQRLNQLLSEDNRQQFSTALAQVGQAAASADRLLRRLDQSVATHLEPALAGLPQLTHEGAQALAALRQGSDGAARAADELRQTLAALRAPGGGLDGLAQSTQAMAQAAERMNRVTLPRVNQAAQATTRGAGALTRLSGVLQENPQALLLGRGAGVPGPGEPGFVAPPAQ